MVLFILTPTPGGALVAAAGMSILVCHLLCSCNATDSDLATSTANDGRKQARRKVAR